MTQEMIPYKRICDLLTEEDKESLNEIEKKYEHKLINDGARIMLGTLVIGSFGILAGTLVAVATGYDPMIGGFAVIAGVLPTIIYSTTHSSREEIEKNVIHKQCMERHPERYAQQLSLLENTVRVGEVSPTDDYAGQISIKQ